VEQNQGSVPIVPLLAIQSYPAAGAQPKGKSPVSHFLRAVDLAAADSTIADSAITD
jgi:hypothetical protein